MSLYIDSKSAAQCRSHHQKMLKKYQSVHNIIDQLISKVVRCKKPETKLKNEPSS